MDVEGMRQSKCHRETRWDGAKKDMKTKSFGLSREKAELWHKWWRRKSNETTCFYLVNGH